MFTAFTMIQTDPEKVSEIAQKIADMPNVAEVYSVTGEWDIIVVMHIHEYEKLDEIVPNALGQLKGVRRTNTILAFRRFSAKDMAWDVGASGR
jgi:DNA-binding Lrp family transcriptional regulator